MHRQPSVSNGNMPKEHGIICYSVLLDPCGSVVNLDSIGLERWSSEE
jgi:hypothetical protein